MLKAKNIFNFILLVFMIVLVVLAFDYNEKARMIPLAVGIITLIMLFIQFIGDLTPKSKKKLPFLNSVSDETGDDKEKNKKSEWKTAFISVVSLLALTLLMINTSYLIAVPLFLFLFIWLLGKAKKVYALSIAIIMTGFMYVLFDILLKANL